MAESTSTPLATQQGNLANALAPHPPISGAYAAPEQKRQYVNTIFDETAQDYDRVERWLSLGSGRWYRRQALQRAGLKSGMRVCDVAVGTGLVAGEVLQIIGPTGHVVGVDPSPQMMRRAKERLGIETAAGRAEQLPFADRSFDFVSMGYALRHVEDLNAAFREFYRVLKPDGQPEDQAVARAAVQVGSEPACGRVCILEITRPTSRAGRAFLRAYLGTLSRIISTFVPLAPRTPELWAYYWETIDKCLPPSRVMEALAATGFTEVKRHVLGGVFSEYTATRR